MRNQSIRIAWIVSVALVVVGVLLLFLFSTAIHHLRLLGERPPIAGVRRGVHWVCGDRPWAGGRRCGGDHERGERGPSRYAAQLMARCW